MYCGEKGPANTFVVTKVYYSSAGIFISGFNSDGFGYSYSTRDAGYWKPTGRHFPEVEELLEKLKEKIK